MEFLVMPQTVHSLVECYSASGGGCYCNSIFNCPCNGCKGDNTTFECPGFGGDCDYTCTCHGVHIPCGVKWDCPSKACTVKAEILNQP